MMVSYSTFASSDHSEINITYSFSAFRALNGSLTILVYMSVERRNNLGNYLRIQSFSMS